MLVMVEVNAVIQLSNVMALKFVRLMQLVLLD